MLTVYKIGWSISVDTVSLQMGNGHCNQVLLARNLLFVVHPMITSKGHGCRFPGMDRQHSNYVGSQNWIVDAFAAVQKTYEDMWISARVEFLKPAAST
jgi:hypothetical protein